MNNKITSKLTDKSKKLKLVAVTKNRSVDEILNLNKTLKFKRIAENRLDEAKEKFTKLPKTLEKHFIGKLQSRKIKEIVEHFDLIQSVENLKQMKSIAKAAKEHSKLPYPILIQVNISNQSQRNGCSPEETQKLIQQAKSIPEINLLGVMGMASHTDETEMISHEFKTLKSLQAELEECSMGMSSDYQEAIEAGTTMLRLGSILFKVPLLELPEFD